MWTCKVISGLSLLSLLLSFHHTLGGDDIIPVELNDDNFEHLTQAATGQTTGKWLVNFISRGCGPCRQLAPTWDNLAHELGTEHKDLGIIVATVNLSDNDELRERFGNVINSFPNIYYFADRKMYEYKGSRTVDDFVEFALGSYSSGTSETVPPPEAPWRKAITALREKAEEHEMLQDMLVDFEHILEIRKNAAVLLFLCGSVFGSLVTLLLSLGGGKKARKEKTS